VLPKRKRKGKLSADDYRIHNLGTPFRLLTPVLLPFALGGIACLLLIYFGWATGQQALFAAGALALIALCGVGFYLLPQLSAHLVLSGDGVEYAVLGVHVYTPWPNVERIGVAEVGQNWGKALGLLLFDPPQVERSGFHKLLFGQDATFDFARIIPITDYITMPGFDESQSRPFASVFRLMPYGADLIHFAPHLFEFDNTPPTNW